MRALARIRGDGPAVVSGEPVDLPAEPRDLHRSRLPHAALGLPGRPGRDRAGRPAGTRSSRSIVCRPDLGRYADPCQILLVDGSARGQADERIAGAQLAIAADLRARHRRRPRAVTRPRTAPTCRSERRRRRRNADGRVRDRGHVVYQRRPAVPGRPGRRSKLGRCRRASRRAGTRSACRRRAWSRRVAASRRWRWASRGAVVFHAEALAAGTIGISVASESPDLAPADNATSVHRSARRPRSS